MKLRPVVIVALLGVYLIWGSTYLAMRFAIESMPPLLMAGIRYVLAGFILFVFLKLRGHAWPTRRQWRDSLIVGVLLLLGGNGMVGLAMERGVSSGMSALVVGVTPLFALIFAGLWGQRASQREWLGIGVGLFGLVLLNFGRELSTSPIAAVLLILAALFWSFGSIWGKHLQLPSGFMASALQMLLGGAVLLLMALLRGESMTAMPTEKALWSLAYLIFIGAILGFSAYVYLLETVRPALATSYAYVNPLVAVGLGVWLGGEKVDALELVAMGIILGGVVMVYLPSFSRQAKDVVPLQDEAVQRPGDSQHQHR